MMQVKFSKMHGVGNDFVVIDNLERHYQFTRQQLQQIGDRRFGIGCDQILLIEAATDGVSDFFYRIYNADGSEAGMCGNGARCFISYVYEHNLINRKNIQLQTLNRQISGQVLKDGLIKVAMGIPNFAPGEIPLRLTRSTHYQFELANDTLCFSALSMGNPHAVIKLDSTDELQDDAKLTARAQALQASSIFPQGVNVNFIVVHDEELLLRTYERGCGFTLACGSGACASAVIALRDNLFVNPVTVRMPGGELIIEWHGGEVSMSGQAKNVFNGIIEL